jgi:DNA-binding XRE family transcriptional regulator
MNKPQFIRSSSGETLVVLPEDEYEALRDAADAAHAGQAMEAVRRGQMPTLSSAEVDEFLRYATPLAFWRGKRKLTQAVLAQRVGISQSYLAGLEKGKRKGDPALFLRLARALDVPMEALVAEDEQP